MSCIFCKIISGQIPCEKVYETDKILAFRDINPVSEEHILIIPKIHIEDIDNLKEGHGEYLADILIAARDIAAEKNLSESGYRLIINNGKAAGQEVFHLHMHLIGGRKNLGPMLQKISAD